LHSVRPSSSNCLCLSTRICRMHTCLVNSHRRSSRDNAELRQAPLVKLSLAMSRCCDRAAYCSSSDCHTRIKPPTRYHVYVSDCVAEFDLPTRVHIRASLLRKTGTWAVSAVGWLIERIVSQVWTCSLAACSTFG
jgi:hypothetical protein